MVTAQRGRRSESEEIPFQELSDQTNAKSLAATVEKSARASYAALIIAIVFGLAYAIEKLLGIAYILHKGM